MARSCSFRFRDDGLNRAFIDLVRDAGVGHSVDEDGVVHFAAEDQELVENDLIGSVRGRVFSSWQVLTCPSDWIGRYREYMDRHGIRFEEELSEGETWFLIPRKHRPHSWKLDGPAKKERLARSQV